MNYLLILMLVALPFCSSAGADLMEKKRLEQLLEERKLKFSRYFDSIDKKSGIFGNKTKRDILTSNEVLIDIVRTDNNIISVLNRAIDYKSFEKTEFNYDRLEQDEKIKTLNEEIKALSAKHSDAIAKLQHARSRMLIYKILFYILLASLITNFLAMRRKRRSASQ